MVSPRNLLLTAGLLLAVLVVPVTAGTASIPAPSGPVVDLAGVLDEGSKRRLAEIIRAVREQTTAELAVLTVATTAPLNIGEYSIAVFDRWKIGKRGTDNGLLFLVAIRDRRFHITTGYGLEGVLPDGKLGEIRDRFILPSFRNGRYGEGILRGTEAVALVILGKPLPAPGRPAATRPGQPGAGVAVGITLGAALFIMLLIIGLTSTNLSVGPPRRHSSGRAVADLLSMVAGAAMGGSARRGGWSSGGFSSGGFGGFGGGSSGGGGAGGSW
jgi:uncharacterized protein